VVADLGDGDDRLYASGVDHRVSVLAGPGADTVDVANGGVDSVACGPGADTVVADAWDAVAADCETVQRTPV
jgi:hypothetical protein